MQALSSLNGLFNERFFKNFLPVPATNKFYPEVMPPDFQLPDLTNGRMIRLSDYRDRQPVVLAFTRIFTEKQYCPLCFPHIKALNEQYDRFVEKGVEVLTIASIDQQQSQRVVQDLGLKMPLLSDPSCQVFRAYQVGQALGAPLPAQFVLEASGKLRYKHLFSFFHPNAEVETLLDKVSAIEVSAIDSNDS